MPVISELIRGEGNGAVSFGDYTLAAKARKDDFEYDGDIYKVKTFREITKLERNGMLVYESVPGTSVSGFAVRGSDVEFLAEGREDVQITLQMEDDSEYEIFENGTAIGTIRTNMSGKLNFSLELSEAGSAEITVEKR